MKWIKASQRLPELKEGDFNEIFVRQISNGYKEVIAIEYLSDHPHWYEWLDENEGAVCYFDGVFTPKDETKWFIEDTHTGLWWTIGEIWRSDRLKESEDSRWTNDPNAAIKWNTREEAEEHNKKYFNMAGIEVTEHLFPMQAKSRCEKELHIEKYFGIKEGDVDYNKDTVADLKLADLCDLLYSWEQAHPSVKNEEINKLREENEELTKEIVYWKMEIQRLNGY